MTTTEDRIAVLEAEVSGLRDEFFLGMSELRGHLGGQKIDLRHLIESLAEMRRLFIARGQNGTGE